MTGNSRRKCKGCLKPMSVFAEPWRTSRPNAKGAGHDKASASSCLEEAVKGHAGCPRSPRPGARDGPGGLRRRGQDRDARSARRWTHVDNRAPVATLLGLSSVKAFIPFALVSVFTPVVEAGEPPPYPTRVEEWVAAPVPSRADRVNYAVWSQASNYSEYEWRVSAREGVVTAQRAPRATDDSSLGLPFTPRTEKFAGASSAIHVPDGWLVAFNHGEFGAALYWFNATGDQNYKVSDNQVVTFLQLPDRLLAVEGIAHMTISRGSIIRIERSTDQDRWTARTVARLPFAPYAAVVQHQHDGRIVIVLSDALVLATANRELQTLLSDVPWTQLYPNSAALNQDQTRVYVGMRQYVTEIDLRTRK